MKLQVSHSPHVRDKATTQSIMRDVIIALLPATACAIYFFGLRAAYLIGTCIAAFIARAVYGKTKEGVGDAGFMSIATLLTAVVVSLLLEALCNKLKWKTFSNFVMPISMFAAMGVAVLLNWYLPAAVSQWTWWNRV